MKKNVGLLDAFIRISVGFFLFGKGLEKESNLLLLFSAMQIATGSTRFSIVYHPFGISTYKEHYSIGALSEKIKDAF